MKKNSPLVVTLHESQEIDRFVAIVTLGLCAAIERGVVTVSDAEVALFSPYSAEFVKQAGGSKKAFDLIIDGAQLEDAHIAVHGLPGMLADLTKRATDMLSSMDEMDRLGKKWIDKM